MSTETVDRTFVLGLDGIPWNLLSRWATDGNLPNFQRIFDEGATGPLESTIPPNTALAWPSIANGVRPDKHGIYAFRRLTEQHTFEMNTSSDIQQPMLWDILSPSVVGNVPMTYPAREIDGKMVTGMITPSKNDSFTYPPNLAAEIDDAIPDYKIGLSWSDYQNREEEFLEDLSDLLSARRELMRFLMETDAWELFFFVYTEPDRLQHLIWDEDVILEHYKELDDILGEVMEYVQDHDANLFVVSDHGFGPVSEFVHLSTLLEQEGFLQRKRQEGTRGVLGRFGVNKDRVQSLLKQLRLDDVLLRVLPDSLVANVANKIPGENKLYDVDFTRTEAFAYEEGSIYINDTERFVDGIVEPDERESVKKRVKNVFESFEVPESTGSVLTVYDGENIFPKDVHSPDLVIRGNGEFEVSESLSSATISKAKRPAEHRMTGIFCAWGPEVENCSVSSATVFDITPTILHSQLKRIPTNSDGTVLNIFSESSRPAKIDPTYNRYHSSVDNETSKEDFDDVEERLKGLGYLS